MKNYQDFKQSVLKNPTVLAEYLKLEKEFSLIEQVIGKRIALSMTQADLAKKIGTRQSAISRFESGNSNPSLGFLQKIAVALEAQLHVSLD
jgi:DNA-binding XRE family transcriptional regulator